MFRPVGCVVAAVMLALASIPAAAQTTPPAGQPASHSQATTAPPAAGPDTSASDRRPATATFLGDTGLWFVPTGEILPDRKWSGSDYRAGFNREEGFTNISHFAVTFGVGLADRVEPVPDRVSAGCSRLRPAAPAAACRCGRTRRGCRAALVVRITP